MQACFVSAHPAQSELSTSAPIGLSCCQLAETLFRQPKHTPSWVAGWLVRLTPTSLAVLCCQKMGPPIQPHSCPRGPMWVLSSTYISMHRTAPHLLVHVGAMGSDALTMQVNALQAYHTGA